MTEYWDLYDALRKPVGRVMARGARVPAGCFHIAVDIWLRDSAGRLLLTRRHPRKNFGGLWECTGGAVIAGETPVEAALRETREEIGLTVLSNQLLLIGTEVGGDWMVDTFLLTDVDPERPLTLAPDEVVDAKWVSADEWAEMHRDGKIVFSVARRFLMYRQWIVQG